MENSQDGKQASHVGAGVGSGNSDVPILHANVGNSDVPILHANVVTMLLGVDEFVLELREWHAPHAEFATFGKTAGVPQITQEQFKQLQPAGVIVMTFSVARQLQEYLNKVLPEVTKARVPSVG